LSNPFDLVAKVQLYELEKVHLHAMAMLSSSLLWASLTTVNVIQWPSAPTHFFLFRGDGLLDSHGHGGLQPCFMGLSTALPATPL